MENVRVFYQKTGRGKYISHLDMTRCMKRALRRAGIPVWYTEGFNPHVYMTFALPISLGFESLCETMDIRLTQPMSLEEIKERLNRVLPEGITAVSYTHLDKQQSLSYHSRPYLKTEILGFLFPE